MRHDPEAGLTVHPDAIENGDTHNDLSDMQRLGKKQEFKVNTLTPLLLFQIKENHSDDI